MTISTLDISWAALAAIAALHTPSPKTEPEKDWLARAERAGPEIDAAEVEFFDELHKAPSPTPAPTGGLTGEQLAETAYGIWRRNDPYGQPPRWRDLTPDQLELLAFIAHYAAGYRRSQPPVPPAADAEGWWVRVEWRPSVDRPEDDLNLYIGGEFVGRVFRVGPKTYWQIDHHEAIGSYRTREEAQLVLLAAVRPKDAGAKT